MAAAVVEATKVTAEQLGIAQEDAALDGHLEVDLGNLTAFDPSPLDEAEFTGEAGNARCLELATSITQCLTRRIFSLPTAPAPLGRLAMLPAPTTPLPRSKPVPKPKELTAWQKFAKEKGIVKRKRSSLVFDEANQQWQKRHGYKRANDPAAVPILEAKPGDQMGEDPFTKMEQEKKERVASNKKRQLANISRSQGKRASGGSEVPTTVQLAASLAEHGKGRPTKRAAMHLDIKAASRLSGVATASQGKFDKRLRGEKDGERQLPGKRRGKVGVVADRTGAERKQVSSLVDRMLREKADDILDVDRAVGKLEADRRQKRREEKLAAAGAASADGKQAAKGGAAPLKAKGGVAKRRGGGGSASAGAGKGDKGQARGQPRTGKAGRGKAGGGKRRA